MQNFPKEQFNLIQKSGFYEDVMYYSLVALKTESIKLKHICVPNSCCSNKFNSALSFTSNQKIFYSKM